MRMQDRKKRSVTWLMGLLICSLILGNVTVSFAGNRESDFRVVGYYSGDLFNEPIEKLQMEKLTHVMYAFLIPKEDGSLVPLAKPEQLEQIVAKGKQTGTKVYIALGGWAYQGNTLAYVFEKVASTEKGRQKLINNVVEFAKEYELDGVEIDWEHPNANTIGDYELLVTEMSDRLEAEGMHLTAAVNGAWSTTAGPEVSQLLTDQCLNSFEFINVMAYDMNNEEHSPLWFANTSIDYWLNRGVAKEKIVVGMPLYARPSWMQYRHLVQADQENAYRDYTETAEGKSYYNSLHTLREKTMIAMRKAGGVMLFDVNEDTQDKTSVVSMVDEVVKRCGTMSREEVAKYVTVILDNQALAFPEEEGMGVPFINEDNRVEVPFRKPLEAIGAKVTYDEKTKTATATLDDTTVAVTIGENKIFVTKGRITNTVNIDTQAIIKDNRIYLPIRAVFEAFGYDVKWSQTGKIVYITAENPV